MSSTDTMSAMLYLVLVATVFGLVQGKLGNFAFGRYACAQQGTQLCMLPYATNIAVELMLHDGTCQADDEDGCDWSMGICSDLSPTRQCLDKFLPTCDEDARKGMQVIFRGINGTHHYICGDGKTMFRENMDCFLEDDVISGFIKCGKAGLAKYFHMMGDFLESDDLDVMELVDNMYNGSIVLRDCLEDLAQDKCGSDAAEFLVEAGRRGIEPFMTL